MSTFLSRIASFAIFLGCAATSKAQDSTGQPPLYPDAGSPPAGIPTIDEGAILLCIGMSQANDECGGRRPQHTGGWRDQSTLPVQIVNGGIDGWDARAIISDPNDYWDAVEQRIADAGFSSDDVQLIWGKNATRSNVAEGGSGDILTERTVLRDNLVLIQQQAEARFPNLRAGFHSSRAYGGFCFLNSELFSYDSIFAIEGWTGEAGAIDSSSLWHRGPYLWADGMNPRGDGLVWLQGDFIADGCHPEQTGIDKIAAMNEGFFAQLNYAPAGSPPPPAPPPPAPPPPAPPTPAKTGGKGSLDIPGATFLLSMLSVSAIRRRKRDSKLD